MHDKTLATFTTTTTTHVFRVTSLPMWEGILSQGTVQLDWRWSTADTIPYSLSLSVMSWPLLTADRS